MNARRSLFVMVALAMVLLLFSSVTALHLRRIAADTERLVISYNALDQWQQHWQQAPSDAALSQQLAGWLAEIQRHVLPLLGPQRRLAESFAFFQSAPEQQARAAADAVELKDSLVWELFECHRLQIQFSRRLQAGQVGLGLSLLLIAVISFFMGRRAQDYRLAPFPEANPNPVLGLSAGGRLIYANRAAHQTPALRAGQSVIELLPDDYRAQLQAMRAQNQNTALWQRPLNGRILQCQVQRLPQLDRTHVYVEDITEQEMIRARNAFIAYHDPVCMLANRQRLEQVISQQRQEDRVVTLVVSFIGGMAKAITMQGLVIADKFARELSIRLRAAYHDVLRPDDEAPLVFRLEANLFGCLYYRALTPAEHQQLAQRLDESVQAPFRAGERESHFSIRTGVTMEPASVSARKLIQHGNLALHDLAGRDRRYQLYDSTIEAAVQTAYVTEVALRHAIEADELELYYQPQLDLQSGRLIGFEALMRWRRHGQMVPPAEFIPIAERTGLIHSLGHWALRDVLKRAMAWQRAGVLQEAVLAVNVSAQEFDRSTFLHDVEQALADFPANPANIQIELTESLLFEDEHSAVERMQQLKALGFSLAIDDFGTGYSSFSYLSRFPIDKLKIDRRFVVNLDQGERDEAIVAAMIEMAHRLGIKVIAEGVETQQQQATLTRLGCDQIQGFLYGHPMDVAAATLFASKQQEQV